MYFRDQISLGIVFGIALAKTFESNRVEEHKRKILNRSKTIIFTKEVGSRYVCLYDSLLDYETTVTSVMRCAKTVAVNRIFE